jgi:hypothetical protein
MAYPGSYHITILTQLCTGIAYFNAGQYDDALAQFDYLTVRNQGSKFCEEAYYYSVLAFGAKTTNPTLKFTCKS